VLRNVCVALGNVAGPEALPALEKAAHDPEPLIAEHAMWAGGRVKARRQV
jgi:epoxyqueuosine reductase